MHSKRNVCYFRRSGQIRSRPFPEPSRSVDAYTTEGISVKGNLNKPLEILDLGGGEVDDSQYSTLTTDKVIDLSGAETAYFLDYEDYYENGTRNVVLQILDSQSMTGMFLDLALSKADNRYDPLPNTPIRRMAQRQ